MKTNIRRTISALCLLATLVAQTAFGYYDPTLQRWLTLDPIGEAGGINLYAFNNNAPVNWVDPDGESPTLVSGGIGFVAGGIIGGGVAWWRGESIWKGAVKGAVVGGVAGLTGGAAGGAAARFLAARGVNAVVVGAGSGAVGGIAGDVAAQGTEMFMGDRCRFNAVRTVTFGAFGAGVGGIAGKILAAKSGVATTTDQAVFWSGRRGANFAAARDFAEGSGRLTLEMTPGGQALPAFSDATRPLWESASREFAGRASGTVNAFTAASRANSIWNTIERPALLNNPNVIKINVIDQTRPWQTKIIYPNRP